MRISDWSSDVCSSDLRKGPWKLIDGLGSGGFSEPQREEPVPGGPAGQLYNLEKDPQETTNRYQQFPDRVKELHTLLDEIKGMHQTDQIERASGRERVCQYV